MTISVNEKAKKWLSSYECPYCGGEPHEDDLDISSESGHAPVAIASLHFLDGDEEVDEENSNLAHENKQMGDFIQLLGFSPDEITSLIVNGADCDHKKAIARINRTPITKIASSKAQELLDFLNGYEESDISFHHEFDERIIHIRASRIANVVQFLQIDVNPELTALEVHYV